MDFVSLKDTNIFKEIGIEQKGHRICETCGRQVPIYVRNGNQTSICMNCNDHKLSQEVTDGYIPPKRRELVKVLNQIEYIPADILDATFADYDPEDESQQKALNLVKGYLDGNYQNLLFRGAPGIGKSHLFRCALREIRNQKVEYKENGKVFDVYQTAVFAKVPELLKTIQETYGSREGLTEKNILDALAEVDVLILDEIGGERSKADPNGFETWSGDILYQILDHRQGKRNLFNTNYTSEDFKKKYGKMQSQRIVSRMMYQTTRLKVEGSDRRMKGGK